MKVKFLSALLLTTSFTCFAQSDVNLAFHMGLGANGHYEIGGTMENNSSETLPHSAVTYITIDNNCMPMVRWNLGSPLTVSYLHTAF